MKETGEYDNYMYTPVIAFRKKEEGENFCDTKNKLSTEYLEEWNIEEIALF